MSDFEPAWNRVVIVEEGGAQFTDHPNDRGGPTKWGITLGAARDFWGSKVDRLFIKNLSEEDARSFYLHLWVKGFDKILDPVAAIKSFSAYVNMGRNGIRCCQRAAHCDVDGVLGPRTIDAINAEQDYVQELAQEMTVFYLGLVEKNPSQKVFLKGWLKRASWVG